MTTIADMVSGAHAWILSNVTDSALTVVANGRTASGIADTTRRTSDWSNDGQTGDTTSVVRCISDDIGATLITLGQTITVDGNEVFVTAVRFDPLGVVASIEYTKQKPLQGITQPEL